MEGASHFFAQQPGSEFPVIDRINYKDEDAEWKLERMTTRVARLKPLEACTDKPKPTQRTCRSYGNGAKLERYSRKRSYLRFMTPGTFFRMILRV